jgi:cyclopropane fatty-acyl-phospholipid synthase-like methyltransferase
MYTQGEYLEKKLHIEDAHWKADRIMAMIGRNKLAIGSVCEIGCGAGEILHELHSQMPERIQFAGYEISPQAYQFCSLREKDRLAFHLADISEIADDSFDLVLALDLFEQIENFYGFLRDLREKGVYKIFHIPLDLSARSLMRVSPLLDTRRHVGHLHHFTKETAMAALEDCGYHVIDYFYTGGTINQKLLTLKTRLAKLPHKLFFKINQDLAVRTVGGYSLMVLAK